CVLTMSGRVTSITPKMIRPALKKKFPSCWQRIDRLQDEPIGHQLDRLNGQKDFKARGGMLRFALIVARKNGI
ncbi:MAG TPA: hypothetical protein VGF90_07605, partial [Verrucomicrobiae bacterium]